MVKRLKRRDVPRAPEGERYVDKVLALYRGQTDYVPYRTRRDRERIEAYRRMSQASEMVRRAKAEFESIALTEVPRLGPMDEAQRERFRAMSTRDAIKASISDNGGHARLRDLSLRFRHRDDFDLALDELMARGHIGFDFVKEQRGPQSLCITVLK